MDRRARASGAEHQPRRARAHRAPLRRARRPAASGSTCASSWPATASSAELDRPCASLEPVVLDRCEIARFDAEAWELYHDFDVLRRLEARRARTGSTEAWAGELLAGLNRVCNVCVGRRPRELGARAGDPRRAAAPAATASHVHELSAIGHAHLDTAWLWPLAETYRKARAHASARSRATWSATPSTGSPARRPSSTPGCRRATPTCTSASASRSRPASWVPVGGTWVEPDCNLPSGESLVRQFLYGQRFFEREFGRRCSEFWNPDVFGYNGQLPQIMRGAGIGASSPRSCRGTGSTAASTTRSSGRASTAARCSRTSRRPTPTTPTATVARAAPQRARLQGPRPLADAACCCSATATAAAGRRRRCSRRCAGSRDLQGVPRTAIGHQRRVLRRAGGRCAASWPTVVGELYFEYHRGTYTTQAAVKRGNRELRAGAARRRVAVRAGRRRAARRTRASSWPSCGRLLLLNQFHDILPGSSIGEVYEDAARDLRRSSRAPRRLAAGRAGAQGERRRTPVNTIGLLAPGGRAAWRTARSGRGAAVRLGRGQPAPAAAVAADEAGGRDRARERRSSRRRWAATALLQLAGRAASGREALAAPGNCSALRRPADRVRRLGRRPLPPRDASPMRRRPRRRSVIAPTRCAPRSPSSGRSAPPARCARPSGSTPARAGSSSTARSTGTSRTRCSRCCSRSPCTRDNATYEMQFGHAERPTHYSTSHDLARYEVPGHRFADLSEHGFGVALLTDCKYGYSTLGDEHADQPAALSDRRPTRRPTWAGTSSPTRSCRTPAAGARPASWPRRRASTRRSAGRAAAPARSCFAVEDPNLVLDTVKRAEDSDALVLRLYEPTARRGTRPPAASALPFARRAAATCSRTGAAARVDGRRDRARPTGRTRSSACCWCNNGV